MKKCSLLVVFLLLTFFYSLFFFQKTNLATSDLGRHIMNGKIIVATGHVFSTNLYSYTNPTYSVPNHHWLFGVIAFYVEGVAGFGGLTIMSALLYTSAIALILWYTGTKYGRTALVIASLLTLPLLTVRSEVRPEAFSLFFFAIELITLLKWQEKKVQLYVVGLIFFVCSILWVNIHIFFILQFLLLGAFGLQALIQKKWSSVGQLCALGIIVIVGTLCNPLGWHGAIYPFQILGDYGYRVAENQSPLFFLQHFPNFFYWYLSLFFVVTIFLVIATGKQQGVKNSSLVILFTILLILSNKLIRFENFFGLVTIIPLAAALQTIRRKYPINWRGLSQSVVFLSLGSLVGFGVLVLVLASGMYFPFHPFYGLGLYPNMNSSAVFFKELHMTEPIFNNFDIGSYLIYTLYPQNQVFVDNRAEAYPSDFLKEYVSAQEDPAVWKKLDDTYHFGAIYFYRHENTEWGQGFLIATTKRPEWVPLYIDNYAIIFVRDIPEHAEIIKKYRLPQKMFSPH